MGLDFFGLVWLERPLEKNEKKGERGEERSFSSNMSI